MTTRQQRAPFYVVFLALIGTIVVLASYLVVGGNAEGDLPATSADIHDAKGEVLIVDKRVDLQWQHPLDRINEELGWPSRLGPFHNGIAPERLENLPWDQALPRKVWSTPIGRGYSSIVLDAQNRLLAFSRYDNQEAVECRRASDGSLLWRQDYSSHFTQPNRKYTDGPIATPVIQSELAYTLGIEGIVACWQLDTGEIVWQRNLALDYTWGDLAFGIGSSPLIFQDQLIIALGASHQHAGIISLSTADGRTNWTSTSHQASYSTPQVAQVYGHDHLVCLTDEGLVSLHPHDGAYRWKIPFRSRIPDSENACTPVILGDLVLVSAYGIGCLCIQLQADGSYQEVWRDHKRPVLDVHYNNMIGLNDFIYGFSAVDRTFRAVHAASGKLASKWRSKMRRGYVTKVGDRFVLFGEHGYLTVLRIQDGVLTPEAASASALLDYPCYSAPAFLQGRLYVRNEKTLACFDLTQRD